jgi:hypothetical protein
MVKPEKDVINKRWVPNMESDSDSDLEPEEPNSAEEKPKYARTALASPDSEVESG